jgi:ActR/RegA family two-component response regulator
MKRKWHDDRGAPKLLIVEDDPGLQAQLKWAYEDFDVFIAGDRASALALLRAEEPAVVTLDLGCRPILTEPAKALPCWTRSWRSSPIPR